MGGVDFSNLYVQLSAEPKPTLALARQAGATLAYGNFITLLINFIIVAFVLFLIIKAVNKLAPPPKPATMERPKQEVLLEEIRDLLARE